MSTLTVTNIKATGETASRSATGVAAAWVNLNGTGTIAARDSLNVSSLTDNGTSDYTVNFTSAFANGNYCATGLINGEGGGSVMAPFQSSRAALVGSHTMETRRTDTFNPKDSGDVNYAYFGDLA